MYVEFHIKPSTLFLVFVSFHPHTQSTMNTSASLVHVHDGLMGYHILGFSLAAYVTSASVVPEAEVFLVSPQAHVTSDRCLTFAYFVRSNLVVSTTNATCTLIMAEFDVDGGHGYHKAFIDLPHGSYQVVWQTMLNTNENISIVKNHRVAIDDINFHNMTCSTLRKSKA